MIEKFIEIKGYPNYQVSDLGRVRSLDMDVWNGKVFYKQKGRVLKHNKDKKEGKKIEIEIVLRCLIFSW